MNIPHIKRDIKFVIELVRKIADKRNYEELIIKCSLLFIQINEITGNDLEEHLTNVEMQVMDLIDELKLVVEIERRFVLFPLPDIKKEAYELGKEYVHNFLNWVTEENNFSQEKLIGILEDDLYTLDEAKGIISRVNKQEN